MNHARVVFECIVDGCDWTLEQAEPDLRHVPIDTTGMNHYDAFNAYITASIGEGLRRADHDDTMAARAHLMGHDVFDFARTIRRLQDELAHAETTPAADRV